MSLIRHRFQLGQSRISAIKISGITSRLGIALFGNQANLVKPIIKPLPGQKHHRENYVVNHEGKLP